MKTFKHQLIGASAATAALLPQSVLAQSYDYDYNYELSDAEAGGILAGLGIFFVVFLVIGLLSLVFWIMMLVHAIKNDIPDKNMWIIILVVSLVVGLGLVGALVYYFAVKRKSGSPKSSQPPQNQPPAKS